MYRGISLCIGLSQSENDEQILERHLVGDGGMGCRLAFSYDPLQRFSILGAVLTNGQWLSNACL